MVATAILRAYSGFSLRENFRAIRDDMAGFNAASSITLVIGLMITIVIFAAVLGTVAYQLKLASTNTSVTTNSTATALLPLVLTMFVIAGVVLPVGAVLVILHEHGTI